MALVRACIERITGLAVMALRLVTRIACLHVAAVAFLLSAGLCLLVSACSSKDDVAVIRGVIQKSARLAEDKQINDLLELTAEGFLALPGQHDAPMVKGILFGAFRYYGRFKIHYPRPTIDVTADGTGATAVVHFLIVRRDQSIPGLKELYNDPRRWLETVGEKADLYQLKLQFKKKDGDWLVQQAQLEGFKGAGF